MDLEKDLHALSESLINAAHNPNVNLALSRAVKSYRENVNKALTRFPHTVERAREVREMKLKALENLEFLYEKAAQSIEENHGRTYLAKDALHALKIVDEIVGTGKLIVKVKSMVGEEIGLREHLEQRGNTLWETDLGEFIQQLRNDRPMHILSPAIHIPREEVAKFFSAFFKKEIPPEIAAEVAAVREFMREKYFKADIGISGANIVAADTGSLFIIENEGNGRLATGAPPVHIVIVGLEKLVPTLDDAFKTAEVTWRYAQYTVPSYVNIISGPSKTGDIEKVTTYGAHGPKELHVIFLDNGRLELSKNETFKEALLCLRCGGCLYECPVFSLTAGHYGYKYLGGIGAIWTAFIAGGLDKAAPLAYVCLRCGRCQERCPMQIDVPRMTVALRQLLTGNHLG